MADTKQTLSLVSGTQTVDAQLMIKVLNALSVAGSAVLPKGLTSIQIRAVGMDGMHYCWEANPGPVEGKQ